MNPAQRRRKLSRLQARYKEAVRWLISDENRGEGRSTLQAIVLCELALENPGQTFRFQDHAISAGRLHDQFVDRVLSKVIHDNLDFRERIERLGPGRIQAKI